MILNKAHIKSGGVLETTQIVDTEQGATKINMVDQNQREANEFNQLIGQTLEQRYLLLRLLGQGGMGVVYEALDQLEDRRVAIKVISSKIVTSESVIKRFHREAKMGMALTHANIVKTYHYGQTEDELIFIVMEFVDGISLREYIVESAPLKPGELLSILEQLCNALDYAHQQGVLHRDLKPANILITRDKHQPAQIKLVDFGIAKLLRPNEDITKGASLTETGVILGTINYIAPEYILGLNLVAASDLYSLGVILFELLTDHLPIEGMSRHQLLYNKVYKDILVPSIKHDFLPRALDAVLERVLNRDPLKRFNSGQEFFTAYRDAINGLS